MSLATRIAQEFNDVRKYKPVSMPYHLLAGDLAVSNEVVTNGFSTKLYTGNGGTQTVTDNVDMGTQWGNDASEKFGGLVWVKSRSGTTSNALTDTVRGVNNTIFTNLTDANSTTANRLTAFNSTGFTLGADTQYNANLATYASWNFQTTHRRTGTTNHGKTFTEHYNPFTGFTIIKYEGSGLAGHEIPHALGRKLGFVTIKGLGNTDNWQVHTFLNGRGELNTTIAFVAETAITTNNSYISNQGSTENGNGLQYILYGWGNSYFDESNKLIGNYEIGVYGGTGVAGNKVTTRGKPAWVMIKRLDSAASWFIFDNLRNDLYVHPNLSNTEASADYFDFVADGFIAKGVQGDANASGGQYLYMVVYDNDSGSGKSKYPKATDTSNIQVNNAIIPFANGVDASGTKVSTISKNESVTGLTYTAGKNYVYALENGTYGVKPYRPRYLRSDLVAEKAGDNPDYFDVLSNTWYSTVANPELVTNGTFIDLTGWTAQATITATVENQRLKIVTNSSNNCVYQAITVLPNTNYKIKWGAEGNSNELFIGTGIKTGEIVKSYIYPSAWTFATKEVTFNSGSNTTLYICLYCSNTGAYTIYFDGVSVYATDLELNAPITARNYLDTIAYADASGQLTYVEELPKVEYKHSLKVDNFDLGQSWQQAETTNTGAKFKDGSSKFRKAGMTYWNTTGKPIVFSAWVARTTSGVQCSIQVTVDGIPIMYSRLQTATTNTQAQSVYVEIPSGSSYSFLEEGTVLSIAELR